MMFNCPVCGRLKCSYWPEHWVFRRGDTFYCSETCYCIDLFRDMNLIKQVELERRQRKVGKLTLEIKKKAVQIAIDGGDPLKYLADCGYTAPDKMWYYIKQKVKENDPKLYAQIPDQRKGKKPEIPEPVSGGPWEKLETPEKTERSSFKAIVNPLEVFSLKSRVLRSGRFEIVGTDKDAMRLVYEPIKEKELLLKKASWEELIAEIKTALDQLGVLP